MPHSTQNYYIINTHLLTYLFLMNWFLRFLEFTFETECLLKSVRCFQSAWGFKKQQGRCGWKDQDSAAKEKLSKAGQVVRRTPGSRWKTWGCLGCVWQRFLELAVLFCPLSDKRVEAVATLPSSSEIFRIWPTFFFPVLRLFSSALIKGISVNSQAHSNNEPI